MGTKFPGGEIMRFTKDRVDGIKATKTGRRLVWDTDLAGFGVRVSAKGRKVYVVRGRTKHGEQFLVTLGAANVLTLKQARAAAKVALGKAANGTNPAQERREARAEERPPTFGELADVWLEDHAKPKRRSWKEDERRLVAVKEAVGKKKPVDVSVLHLTRLHRRIGETRGKTEANRTVTTVRAVFGKAVEWKLLPRDFDNPASGVDLYEEAKRTRIVRRDEFPELLGAIQSYGDPIVAGAILTLVFTGLRKRDVLDLRWSDVDLDAGFMALRTQKTGEVRMVAISEATMRVLTALPRFQGNPYVFPGRKAGRPLQSLKTAWGKIRKEAGCPDLRLHDLKRTVGTMLALAGENQFVIQQVLGHKDERTARHYVQLAAEMTSGVMERYAAQVEAAGTPKALVGGPKT